MTEFITPTSEDHWNDLRLQDVTSTEVSALFGCCPYITEYELWHRKHDKTIVEFKETERMKWGNRLEASIAKGIAEDFGWAWREMKEYGRLPKERVGASFDFEILHPKLGQAALEVKNVDGLEFRNKWVEDGDDIEAPPHIELQLQQQLLVTGWKIGYIGTLVGGNRVVVIERRASKKIAQAILSAVASFWESIDAGNEPAIDFDRDSDFISLLYNHAEPGSVIEPTEEITTLALEDHELQQKGKEIESGRKKVKAQLLAIMGEAEKCKGDDFSISAGVIGAKMIEAHERRAYRSFRINWKKEKKS